MSHMASTRVRELHQPDIRPHHAQEPLKNLRAGVRGVRKICRAQSHTICCSIQGGIVSRFLAFSGRSITVLALLCACTSTGSAYAASTPDACTGVSAASRLTVDQLPTGVRSKGCDLTGRVVVNGTVGVAVPARGETVRVDAVRADGGETPGLSVSVAQDGAISYRTHSAETGESASAGALSACSDTTRPPTMHEEIHAYTWYVGDGGMPGALTQAQAQAAFADAINNITGTYNDCGIADTVDAKSSYGGTSTYEADINASSQCTPRDKQNTWDAGDLAAGHLAVTCSWTVDGTTSSLRELIEADVRYNTTDHDFTNSPSSSCTNLYDIRGVGTHEAGHVFGLDHVSAAHPDLTMSPSINRCDTSDRTLGRGDYLTLEAIY